MRDSTKQITGLEPYTRYAIEVTNANDVGNRVYSLETVTAGQGADQTLVHLCNVNTY